MFCTICAGRVGPAVGKIASIGLLALATLFGSQSEVYAQQQDSILKQAFKVFGFATDVAPPADFVDKTRLPSDPDYIPVFQPPPEPARPTLKTDDLKTMKSDLDAVGKQHDTLRQGFAPAAKAMAEQQAAQKKPKATVPSAQQ
jgi:hypothetical protein